MSPRFPSCLVVSPPAHEVSRLYPAQAEELAPLLEAMRTRIEANPRGWIQP